MPCNDLRAEHPLHYDKPGSPYFAIDAAMDGWPIVPSPVSRDSRPRDCHLCGAKHTGGTCEACLGALRERADGGLEVAVAAVFTAEER